jgi:gliding motility associated protien GldN
MKKILIFNVLFALLLSFNSFAQDENAEQEEEEEEILEPMTPRTTLTKQAIVRSKKPIAYNEINEEDILWSQTIWRRIDCRERMNFHLYYPTEDLETRKSLVQALVEGIRKNQIQAYDTDELKKKVTIEQIMDRLDAEDKVITEPKMDGTGDTTYTRKGFVDW